MAVSPSLVPNLDLSLLENPAPSSLMGGRVAPAQPPSDLDPAAAEALQSRLGLASVPVADPAIALDLPPMDLPPMDLPIPSQAMGIASPGLASLTPEESDPGAPGIPLVSGGETVVPETSHQRLCCCERCDAGFGYYAPQAQTLRSWNGLELADYEQTFSQLVLRSATVPEIFSDTSLSVALVQSRELADSVQGQGDSLIEFEPAAGITVTGESWGVAWGDVNADGLPDVYLGRHLAGATLLVNQGDGTFQDQTRAYFGAEPRGDKHGVAWADYDNDGDLDLLQLRGGAQTTQLFQNNGAGRLVDVAAALNADYPGSGRSPVWFDFNGDGRLDIVLNMRNRDDVPPTILQQRENSVFESAFEDVGFETGFTPESGVTTLFSVLADVGDSSALDLLTRRNNDSIRLSALSSDSLPFQPISLPPALVEASAVNDIISADFDGDLQNDIFLARGTSRGDVFQPDARNLNFYLDVGRGEKSVRFKAEGTIALQLPVTNEDIWIGENRENPSNSNFVLSSFDADVYGQQAGRDRGIYVYYNPADLFWTITWVNPGTNADLYGFVEARESPISEVETLGFDPRDQFLSNLLFRREGNRFVDVTTSAGFEAGQTAAFNAVAGDLDNDMDLDIYVVSTGYAGNRENIVYENQGTGQFIARRVKGGAGTDQGLGDSASLVDYDLDGHLDVFLANGNFFNGLGAVSRGFFNDAPYELLRNKGNENHWLQLDLVGVNSNRDAVGTRVIVTAGGVRQLREQNNGMHNHAQNFQRIHFGLGQNRRAASVEISWTNGMQHTLQGVNADQILTVTEGIGFTGRDVIIGTAAPEQLNGLAGNDRLVGKGGNDILLGGRGNDDLFGDSGQDVLVGQAGSDRIRTGGGRDVVRFERPDDGGDRIFDFSRTQDRFELVATEFAIALGSLDAAAFRVGTQAQSASERIIYRIGTGELFFDPDGVGGQTQVLLATLVNKPQLTAQNFVGI
ncbi:cartilage acidic protein [Lyngbya confervoides]|uniref:FG-GAP-like repeat-containing protein n=1 Tax=Lyngbya confervoides BDU141951 TaxID=1574623 RepID=A0ABD4T4D5_9CYAN|nr:CRTAC homolog protein [Lyngbya confervoides]MCM1983582.1 FG-GAP-like repeat-containing protein [Lyngbya confervoides BDU141951]